MYNLQITPEIIQCSITLQGTPGQNGQPGQAGLPGESGERGERGDPGDDGLPGAVVSEGLICKQNCMHACHGKDFSTLSLFSCYRDRLVFQEIQEIKEQRVQV